MDKRTFLLLLDDLIEEEPGTLDGSEILKDAEGWDSLAAVGFIALVDEEFELIVSPKKLAACNTVNDLLELLGANITD